MKGIFPKSATQFVSSVMAVSLFAGAAFVAVAAATDRLPAGGFASPRDADARLEAAILREDWSRVIRLVGSDDSALSPWARLIKGHAYLATNRNNESLNLFSGVRSEDELSQWQAWAEELRQGNPGQPVAHYLAGDALARLQRWDDAVAAFDEALRISPQHPLALNARGVGFAVQRRWDQALLDLAEGARVAPPLADAYANRGTMYLQKKEGAEGALRAFNRALDISPEFVLALNGRASTRFALGDWDGAQKDLEKAFEKAGDGGTATHQAARDTAAAILAYVNGEDRGETAEGSDAEAGTSLDRAVSEVYRNPTQSNINRLVSQMRGQPAGTQSQVINSLQSYGRMNPAWATRVNSGLDRVTSWNRPGGPAEGVSSLIPSQIGGSVGRVSGSVGGVNLQQHQLKVTQGNYSLGSQMRINTGVAPISPGGVTTSLRGAHLDEGEWPFVAPYGLLYQVNAD